MVTFEYYTSFTLLGGALGISVKSSPTPMTCISHEFHLCQLRMIGFWHSHTGIQNIWHFHPALTVTTALHAHPLKGYRERGGAAACPPATAPLRAEGAAAIFPPRAAARGTCSQRLWRRQPRGVPRGGRDPARPAPGSRGARLGPAGAARAPFSPSSTGRRGASRRGLAPRSTGRGRVPAFG